MESDRCFTCHRKLDGTIVEALNHRYHDGCFTCTECDVRLSTVPFRSYNDIPYCEEHYLQKFGKKCADCGDVIRGVFVEALGKPYHKEHFRCWLCKNPFEGGKFIKKEFVIDDLLVYKPVCKNCFSKTFSDPCAKCGKGVGTENVLAMGRSWHPDCFRCTACNKKFEQSMKFVPIEGAPYCVDCANSKRSPDRIHITPTSEILCEVNSPSGRMSILPTERRTSTFNTISSPSPSTSSLSSTLPSPPPSSTTTTTTTTTTTIHKSIPSTLSSTLSTPPSTPKDYNHTSINSISSIINEDKQPSYSSTSPLPRKPLFASRSSSSSISSPTSPTPTPTPAITTTTSTTINSSSSSSIPSSPFIPTTLLSPSSPLVNSPPSSSSLPDISNTNNSSTSSIPKMNSISIPDSNPSITTTKKQTKTVTVTTTEAILCPNCSTPSLSNVEVCPTCGYQFKHDENQLKMTQEKLKMLSEDELPIYPYMQLTQSPYSSNVDISRREFHLSDHEFESLFGCSKAEYKVLPLWKQKEKKRKLKLF
ncbi:hypothetical protein WA158_002249 [Blastocystis sp. Blastoise]